MDNIFLRLPHCNWDKIPAVSHCGRVVETGSPSVGWKIPGDFSGDACEEQSLGKELKKCFML